MLLSVCRASLVAQTVNNLPAMPETWVRSLGWEDLEKGMATHSCILAWRIPGTEEPGELHRVHGVAELERTETKRTQVSAVRAGLFGCVLCLCVGMCVYVSMSAPCVYI